GPKPQRIPDQVVLRTRRRVFVQGTQLDRAIVDDRPGRSKLGRSQVADDDGPAGSHVGLVVSRSLRNPCAAGIAVAVEPVRHAMRPGTHSTARVASAMLVAARSEGA